MATREYTDLQKRFLAALPESKGDIRQAMREAGYSDNTPIQEIVKSLKEEILEVTREMLAMNAPFAAASLVEILRNSNVPGIGARLTAIKEILDRVGVIKEEKISVESTNGIFILPAKRVDDDALANRVTELDA